MFPFLARHMHLLQQLCYILSITAAATPIFLFGFGELVKTLSSSWINTSWSQSSITVPLEDEITMDGESLVPLEWSNVWLFCWSSVVNGSELATSLGVKSVTISSSIFLQKIA